MSTDQNEDKGLTVTIGGATYPVTLPMDHATRWDLAMAFDNNPMRASAAILGICVSDLGLPSFARYQCNVMKYGAACIETLIKRGIDPGALKAVAPIYEALLVAMLPSEQEVSAGVDFSSAEG